MQEKVKFPETVFIIDSDFLNFVAGDLKKHFEGVLNRELPEIKIDEFITYMALDAALKEAEKEIMVILVHDTNTKELIGFTPSDLGSELNGVAFRNRLGEFAFISISPEGFVTRQELFVNLMSIISDSPEIKKAIVVPFEDEHIQETLDILNANENKEFVIFGMNKPKIKKHQWELLAYPLMQSLGIKGDEI